MVDRLLHRKKCLIIVGRTTMEEDVASWAEEILYRYSATHGLWQVAKLNRDPPQCDVGILSFTNLYDIRMLTSNRDFLAQTGFVAPLVVTAVYAFLAIRHDGVSMLDFLRYAGAFFFGRQRYEWRQLP